MLFVSGLKAASSGYFLCPSPQKCAPQVQKKGQQSCTSRDFNGFANNPFFRGALDFRRAKLKCDAIRLHISSLSSLKNARPGEKKTTGLTILGKRNAIACV